MRFRKIKRATALPKSYAKKFVQEKRSYIRAKGIKIPI